MKPSTWTKQPSEKRKLKFDMSRSLSTDDSVVSATATIYEGSVDKSATMLSGSPVVTDLHDVYITVQAGESGKTYWLKIVATTLNGDIIEDDLKVVVKQIGK